MPRYYFHLLNDVDARDEDGKEFSDLEAAREYAKQCAIFSAAEAIRDQQHFISDHRVQVEDAEGNVLHTVRFGDVVAVKL